MLESDFPVVPAKMALINVDMQNLFVDGYPLSAPDGLVLLARINGLARVCRAAGILVIHAMHVLRPDGSNVGVLGELVPPVKRGVIDRGSESAALHDDLDIRDGDIILEKPRYGAFHGTDLELILHGRGIDSVIVTGITTSVCCETTAREANARDFRVFFPSDGTSTFAFGGMTKEEIERATCVNLAHCFAQVLTVDELTARIEEAGAQVQAAE
jgi:ureidoacrylate peracid hydrolase